MARRRRTTTRRKRTPGGYKKPMKVKVKKGALRKQLGTKKGKKIPVSTLRRLKKSKNPQTRKRANFALNARKWRKVGGRRRRR